MTLTSLPTSDNGVPRLQRIADRHGLSVQKDPMGISLGCHIAARIHVSIIGGVLDNTRAADVVDADPTIVGLGYWKCYR
jgi:hypothetical protein